MASESDLHSETNMLPVKQHFDMLSVQNLASTLRPDHPANEPVRRPAGRRDKKKTLQSKFRDDVADRLVDGSLPPGAYPETKKAIHTKYVSQSIAALENNSLLNAPAPEIDASEKQLPRPYRSALSQLRSSHCTNLASYQHRVGRSDSPICPHCRLFEETTDHIFSCASIPTGLLTGDLWRNPTRVATQLYHHPSFDLPPLDAPPLRPPPAPTWQPALA